MSERDTYMPGVPCWVEALEPDVDAAVGFYRELFGWDFDGPGPMPDGGRYYQAELRGRAVAGVAPQPRDYSGPPAWITHVAVDSAGDAADRSGEAGGAVLAGPLDVAPAGRLAVLADPTGAVFCAWEGSSRKGAQVVNEASAWSMSALHTPDPEAAKRYYGEMFGWETEPFDMGGMEMTLFRLPGYVGGEPQQPVPRDVVAVLMPPDERPARWNPDFWVKSAERAAEAARERGGKVLMGPVDAGPFRSAALADPQGAPFGVSELRVS